MINQPPESRFVASLKLFFDSIDPEPTCRSALCGASIRNPSV